MGQYSRSSGVGSEHSSRQVSTSVIRRVQRGRPVSMSSASTES
ncbi:hypothetical protein [Nonomuraea sp. NPDC052265]